MSLETITEESYQQSVLINTTTERAFEALTLEVAHWWGDTDRLAEKTEDIFKVSWGKPYYQFRVTDLVPKEKISWVCIDCHQIHEGLDGIEKEWVGTKLHWTIEDMCNGQTRVSLLHVGLVPSFNCYEVCHSGWNHFINERLKDYLERV